MENVKYGNIEFTVMIPTGFACTYAVSVDGMQPAECTESNREFIYTFLLPRGQHTVEIESIPMAKNSIGKLSAEFFSASSKKRQLNHLLAFHHDIACFSMTLALRIHRDAHLKLGIQRKSYTNFLNVDCIYHSPFVSVCQNIKQESVSLRLLGTVKAKKKFYCTQAALWTAYCFLLLLIFGAFAVTNILDWNTDSGVAGHNGASLFVIGSFPAIILTLYSYFYHMCKLYRQYKDDFLL